MRKSNGYLVDLAYPAYFYADMQPLWIATVLRLQGVPGPAVEAPFSYCELGCGTGLNLVVAAALNPQGAFVGVDFNERHIATARAAADTIGLNNVEFVCADFQAFSRTNGRQFDFIVSHGTWSWVAPGIQKTLLEIIARALKPRGVVYLHYMCHPGSTPMVPIQKLFNEVARQAPGDAREAVRQGLAMVDQLLAAGLFQDQPDMLARLGKLREVPVDDLAHDLLSDFWSVHHSSDVHWLLAQAGAHFVGSAAVFENMDPALSMPQEMLPLLALGHSGAAGSVVCDLARRQQQRTDLFQREPSRLAGPQHVDALKSIRFRQIRPLDCTAPLKFDTPVGELEAPADVFAAILGHFPPDAACSLETLIRGPGRAMGVDALLQAVQLLMHAQVIHPAPGAPPVVAAKARASLAAWLHRSAPGLRLIDACATATVAEPVA